MGNAKKPAPPPPDKSKDKPASQPPGGLKNTDGSTTQRPPQLKH